MIINKKNNVITNFQFFLNKKLLRGNSLYKLEVKIKNLTRIKFNFQVKIINLILANSLELLDFTAFFFSKDKITGLFSYSELIENNPFLDLDEFYAAYKDCTIEQCLTAESIFSFEKLFKSDNIVVTRFNEFHQNDWGLLFDVLERNQIIIKSQFFETKFSEFNSFNFNLKQFNQNPLLNLLIFYFKFTQIKFYQSNLLQSNKSSSSSWNFFSSKKNLNLKLLLEKKIKQLFTGQLILINFYEKTIASINLNPNPIFDEILDLDFDIIEFNDGYYNMRLNKILSKDILINNIVYLNKLVFFNKPIVWLEIINNNKLVIKKLNSYLISKKEFLFDLIKIKNTVFGDLLLKTNNLFLVELIQVITCEFINSNFCADNLFSVIKTELSDIIYFVINNNE